jgi:hypothetical protein
VFTERYEMSLLDRFMLMLKRCSFAQEGRRGTLLQRLLCYSDAAHVGLVVTLYRL